MKTNKGFTLIELLAVIVILAIIALIATPIIMGVIEKTREGAARSSAYSYADAVALELMQTQLTGSVAIDSTSYTNTGVLVKGTKPTAVNLTIQNAVVAGGTMTIGGYTVTFDTSGTITSTSKVTP